MRVSAFWFNIPLAILLALSALHAQTQLVRGDFFPAEQEFQELQKIQGDESFKDAASLRRVADGALFADVGFEHYASRTYGLASGGTLSIEILTLKDSKAAYSLVTLLRKSTLVSGSPGEFHSQDGEGLIFARGYYFVRVRGAAPDVVTHVATSVSNRIGQRETSFPALVGHFPRNGYDLESMRYFLGPHSFDLYSVKQQGSRLAFESGMEIAQARYSVDGQAGTLSLISFPTHELAEAFQNSMEGPAANDLTRTYVKRAGPLVSILEGNFDPAAADKLLSSIHFTYAIKWIYDKNTNRGAGTIWGVPMPILGTVVRSIVFVAILCGLSILAGVSFALFRVWLRGYAPQNFLDRPERTEMTRLKIDEK